MRDLRDAVFAGSDRFELRCELGRGGLGVVYEALDRENDSVVALKALRRTDGDSLYRLKNEFRALQQLRHRNLVQLHELFEVDGHWFFTMELVRGTDLLSYVRGTQAGAVALDRAGPEAEARLRDSLRQLAEGLIAVHESGRVHRDIKPSNVRVTEAGRVVLMDFGFVTSAQEEDQSRDGVVVGTAAYMAPEQASEIEVAPAADWYSVGVVLYEALTGSVPFRGPPLRVLTDKLHTRAVPVRERAAGAPPDLARLCDELLRTSAEERPEAAAILRRLGVAPASTVGVAAVPVSADVPFVGRSEELAMLQEAFDEARGGRSVVVEVCGESGVGKTALVHEWSERIQSAHPDCAILGGRCREQEWVPYKGLDGVVDSLARYLRRLPDQEAAALVPRHVGPLRQMFPVLERVTAIAEVPETLVALDPHELRYRASEGLRELLEWLGRRRSVIVVIDDVQWADRDSLRLLEHLTSGDEAPSVLFVAIARSSEGSANKTRVPGARRIALDRLAPAEARQLARVFLEAAGVRGVSPAQVAVAGGGHPLYIGEVARHASTGSGTKAPRLDDAIWERVGGLPDDARLMIELVAVLGVPTHTRVLREAAEITLEPAQRAIGLLRAASLVRVSDSDTAEIEAYHDRVREAVVARLDDETVLERRRQLARGLQTSGVGRTHPELLLAQLEALGERQLAARLAIDASSRALEELAFDRAAFLLGVALRDGDFSPDERRAHVCARAEALASAGLPLESAEEFLIAADLASPRQAVRLRSRAGAQLLRGGRTDDGLATLADVLAAIGVPLPRGTKGLLWRILRDRVRLRLRGVHVPADWPSRVRDDDDRLYLDTLAELSNGLGMFDALLGSYFKNLHLLAALRRGAPEDVVVGLTFEIVYASLTRRKEYAERCLRTLRGITGAPASLRSILAGGAEAMLLYQQCRWAETCEAGDASIAEMRSGGEGWWWEIATVQSHCLWASFYAGDFAQLRSGQRNAVRDSYGRGDAFNRGMLALGLCNAAWLVEDRPRAGDVAADEAIQPWRHPEMRFPAYWYAVAKVNIGLYRADAEEAGKAAAELFHMPGWMASVPMIRSEAKHTIGRTALARAVTSKSDSDLRVVERMARQLLRNRLPVGPVLGTLLRGGARAVRGDTERARADLEQGAELAGAAGMRGFESAARRALGLLIGGDEGDAMVRAADDALTASGVEDPAAFARMLLPGAA